MVRLEHGFVGVDVGTTHLKVAIISRDGVSCCVNKVRTPVDHDEYGDCHDPDELFRMVCNLIEKAASGLSSVLCVDGIGISSVGEEGVPLGERCEVLYPAIAWYERRRSRLCDEWLAGCDLGEFYGRTGVHWQYGLTLAKWFWLKTEQPDLWQKIHTWVGVGDYIAYRFSGQLAMSFSHASRTGALEVPGGVWNDEWVGQALPNGVDCLPRLVPAGQIIGYVLPGTLGGVRISDNAPVVLTGLDHVVGAYAAGVSSSAELLDSMGTAEAFVRPWQKGFVPKDGLRSRFDFNFDLFGSSLVAISGVESGRCASAVRELLLWKEKRSENGSGGDEELLEGLARECDVGSCGVRFLPDFSNGDNFVIRVKDLRSFSPGTVMRSVLESWSVVAWLMFEWIGMSDDIARVSCIGGGVESRLWLEIKASVLERPLRIVRTKELVASGAALFAMRAVHGEESVRKFRSELAIEEVEPVRSWISGYRALREDYRSMLLG
jgi:xylulokinase